MKSKTGYSILISILVVAILGFGAALILMFQSAPRKASLIGGPFQLVAQDGRVVTDKDFAGSPFLIFFGYTHCPDICPTTLFQATEVLKALGPEAKIKVAFVTVDPERDTPATLKEYLASFDPRITGLSGDRAATDAMIRAYRAYAKKVPVDGGDYVMDHTAAVILMDKQGHFVSAFNLDRKPEEAARELRPYL